MKAQLLMLSAAGLVLAAGSAGAAERHVDRYIERASQAATAQAQAAGVPLAGEPISVKATVGADGRLNGLRVVRSSGSLETDQQATRALRLLKVAGPPSQIVGADVTLKVGGSATAQGSAH